MAEVENILLSTLDINDAVDWEVLKNKFQPKLNFFSKIFKSLKAKAIAESENIYKIAYENWQKTYEEVTKSNNEITAKYDKSLTDYNTSLMMFLLFFSIVKLY